MCDNLPHLSALDSHLKQILQTISQQIETITKLDCEKMYSQNPDAQPELRFSGPEICGGNFKYRLMDDGTIQVKHPDWVFWEDIRGLSCSWIYAFAQDSDVFLSSIIQYLKEKNTK